jgi:hypothetical protein
VNDCPSEPIVNTNVLHDSSTFPPAGQWTNRNPRGFRFLKGVLSLFEGDGQVSPTFALNSGR